MVTQIASSQSESISVKKSKLSKITVCVWAVTAGLVQGVTLLPHVHAGLQLLLDAV